MAFSFLSVSMKKFKLMADWVKYFGWIFCSANFFWHKLRTSFKLEPVQVRLTEQRLAFSIFRFSFFSHKLLIMVMISGGAVTNNKISFSLELIPNKI